MAYMDDAIAYSRDWQSHLRHVDDMLQRIRDAGLKIAPNKCEFGCAQMVFLGTLINKDGNRPDPAKIEAVASAPRPVDKHTVRAFYGLASYYAAGLRTLLPLPGRCLSCSKRTHLSTGALHRRRRSKN